MERNDAGAEGFAGGQSGANEFSGSGSPPQGRQFDYARTESTAPTQGISDRARNALGSAGEKLADVGSGARDKVGSAKEKLADALESGAERLRERGNTGSATLATATADGSTPIQGEGTVAQVSDRVAGGMEATADWLRAADIDGLKASIEQQVRDHPARTLLIATGLGYLAGRAFREEK